MVEHSTADREVPGSNPGAPLHSCKRPFLNTTTSTGGALDIAEAYTDTITDIDPDTTTSESVGFSQNWLFL